MNPTEPRVIELRQYTLQPGRRDTLIELFEREFVEPQEAAGMRVIGSFRDLDDADRFVWLRGFADMPARAAALAAFYGGPVWRTHRDAANATMIDSDDVLLLRPTPGSPRFGATQGPPGRLLAAVFPLAEPAGFELLAIFENQWRRASADTGARVVATLVTEPAPNNYPRLPVREGESVLVGLVRFDTSAAHERHRRRFEDLAGLPTPRLLRLESTRRIA